ncbi:MAG: hypothetical protein H6679_04260 [Epsilonproteobacteria bacterium]|nr:hypothetical protein [Campylobacterota bacterium]
MLRSARYKVLSKTINYFQFNKNEAIKLICLGLSFFFVISSYSILRSLKTSVFLGLVGREYKPLAKIIAIFFTLPAILWYSKLIDKLKRYQVVCFFFAFYALLSVIFAYLFAHPVYGLRNAQTGYARMTGWAFELFMDLFQALVVSALWGFINSISTTKFATQSYGFIVAASRIGGISAPILSWFLLERTNLAGWYTISLLTLMTSVFLLLAAYFILKMIKKVPEQDLYGYCPMEEKTHANPKKLKKGQKPGAFEGLKFIIQQPYVMGIFGLVFCFEMINMIFDYQFDVHLALATNADIQLMSKVTMLYTATFQGLSFFFAFFSTSTLLKRLGLTTCLLITPAAIMILNGTLMLYPSLATIFVIMVIMRALNYGFNHPLREMLYIPTIKNIQFKSKAWIESFGRTFAKTSGSTINQMSIGVSPIFATMLSTGVPFVLTLIWALVALLVSKTYLYTIKHKLLIGSTDQAKEETT